MGTSTLRAQRFAIPPPVDDFIVGHMEECKMHALASYSIPLRGAYQ